MEMSIDTPFRLWHQRVECHIFCQWDWAAARGLVANTIEECKHTEGHERPINASSLGLINYPKKETEVWGHRETRSEQDLSPNLCILPLSLLLVPLFSALLHFLTLVRHVKVWTTSWPLVEVKKTRANPNLCFSMTKDAYSKSSKIPVRSTLTGHEGQQYT